MATMSQRSDHFGVSVRTLAPGVPRVRSCCVPPSVLRNTLGPSGVHVPRAEELPAIT
jgi:hypothetical protein